MSAFPVALTIPLSPAVGDGTVALEAALVRRVQAGDLAAFDELTRRYLPRALRVARRVAPTAEDAEDVVQEAFMSALRAIGTFDLARPFGFWLDRIVVNRALSLRRSRARKREEDLGMDVVATGEGPSEAVERGEVMDRFRAALAGLPPRQRVIVQMFEVDGLSSPEIAELLGISDGTVRWHVHAARQVLRAALAPFAPGGIPDGT